MKRLPPYPPTVWVRDGNLFVNSISNEKVSIYSITGTLIYQAQKQAGEARFSIGKYSKQNTDCERRFRLGGESLLVN
ncbi:hypothetical protein FACS1894123_06000 [Bacteroidia bacterium]|nr:hypothetical protein FACS1894123_06000 [Bacteroidia bacterium]